MLRPDSRIRAYLELLRLPNVFTAVADVLMGCWFVTNSQARPDLPELRPGIMLLLIGSSCCLYLAGMVLNDYFDRDKDAEERPARPIPSRRVPESAAQWLGSELLIIGVALAWLASYFNGSFRSGLIAIALAAAVVLYDGRLKSTPLGPLGMGACRFLNVLLGMSIVSAEYVPWGESHFMVAGGIGVYIVGVTWFARTEAVMSSRPQLVGATLVMWLGIAMLACFPLITAVPTVLQQKTYSIWFLLWLILGGQIGWRCLQAVFAPLPGNVQYAVKNCILSLIVLNAAVTIATQGYPILSSFPPQQLQCIAILALLAPTVLLGRWIYST
jgi:4-hydroxybenzoate polyprenyltransferase